MSKNGHKPLQRIKNNLIYYTARGSFRLAGVIPLNIGMKIGAAIGAAAWSVLRYERECSRQHLRVAFPELTEAEREAIGKESFRNLGRSFFELFHFDELLATAHTDKPYVTWIGHEHMEKIMAEGRGGIHATGHIGCWELMAAWSVAYGDSLNEIVRSLYDSRIDKALNDHRRHYNYIPLTRGGKDLIADIVNVFQKNEWLGILMDQDTKVRGVFADWFGHPAWTPSGPAFLCYQANLDAVVTTIHRNPAGGHTIVTSPPVPRPQTGDMNADVQAYTERLNQILCDRIRQYPSEWVWMHRRWKTRPKGEPPEKHPAPRPQKPQRLWQLAERLLVPPIRKLSWQAADRIGAGLGRLLFYVKGKLRNRAKKNLAAAFPEKNSGERKRLARAAFAHFGGELLNYLRHPLMDARFFSERVELEGREHLDRALAQGKGAVLVGAHFGGWETGLWKLATLGYVVHCGVARLKNKFLHNRLTWLRRAHGVEYHQEGNIASAMTHALKANQVAAFALDCPAKGKRTLSAMLFGREFPASTAPLRLAVEHDCVVLPAWSEKVGPGLYRVTIGEPLPMPADLPEDQAVMEMTVRSLAVLERTITRTPTQWLWWQY